MPLRLSLTYIGVYLAPTEMKKEAAQQEISSDQGSPSPSWQEWIRATLRSLGSTLQDKALVTAFKQTTPTKRACLILEDIPQVLIALLFSLAQLHRRREDSFKEAKVEMRKTDWVKLKHWLLGPLDGDGDVTAKDGTKATPEAPPSAAELTWPLGEVAAPRAAGPARASCSSGAFAKGSS